MNDPREYNISVRYTKDDDEGFYCATVKELPDISAYEATAESAYATAIALIRDAQNLFASKGRAFPPPLGTEDYSGRTTVRMSKSLHARVVDAAERDDISLNQWIVEALAWRLDGAKTPRTVIAPNAVSVTIQSRPISSFGSKEIFEEALQRAIHQSNTTQIKSFFFQQPSEVRHG